MGNESETKIKKIMDLAKNLPYFSIDDLLPLEKNRDYLKILLSRYEKKGKVVRLKKGFYAVESYFAGNLSGGGSPGDEKNGAYCEFLANALYSPSYLSLEYALYKHNLLTELPNNFTSVSKNKTKSFSNKLGNFFYHKIKDELFTGFRTIKKGKFTILEASKAKALFDFLYLRKNIIVGKEAIKELRLNLDEFSRKDVSEFKKYIKLEGSRRMEEIAGHLFG